MSLRDIELQEGPFIFFDQQCKYVAVGTHKRINLYDVESLDSNDKKPYRTIGFKNAHIINIYCDYSKLFFVCRDQPKKLVTFHIKLNKLDNISLDLSKAILAIKSCNDRLVVWTKDCISIRNPANLQSLHRLYQLPENPYGVCAITSKPEQNLIAFPKGNDMTIFCLDQLNYVLEIPEVHKSPLAAIVFSPCGKKIATAGETGTLLRVFSAVSGVKLYEFRRGNAATAQIFSMAFSSEFLCCSSDRPTIHIFKMNQANDDQAPSTSSSNSDWFSTLTSFLPNQLAGAVSHVMEATSQVKNFAHIPFFTPEVRRIVGFKVVQNELRVLVAQENQLLTYEIPPRGGKCQLLKDHDIL